MHGATTDKCELLIVVCPLFSTVFRKRGDRYLRMLLTHGARSVLRAASVAQTAGRQLDHLRQWALAVQARSNHNKAACALANKLARICFAALRDAEPYTGIVTRMKKKMERTAYAMPT